MVTSRSEIWWQKFIRQCHGMENLPCPFTLDELQMMIDEQLPSWLLFKGIVSLLQLVECRMYDYSYIRYKNV